MPKMKQKQYTIVIPFETDYQTLIVYKLLPYRLPIGGLPLLLIGSLTHDLMVQFILTF